MISRRDFLKTAALAGTASLFNPFKVWSKYIYDFYFGLNSFIESHPEAVFVMLTNVKNKTDSNDIKSVGYGLGKTLFVLKNQDQSSFPIGSNVVFKPNLTQRGKWMQRTYTIEGSMGVVTDCYFVEGLINSIKDLGTTSDKIFIREANYTYDDLVDGGYIDMANRSGINFKNVGANINEISASDLQWIDTPDGVWFKRIPYLWPINSPGSVLVNVAKFKAHSMGLTLCAKNLQGTIAPRYVSHCTAFGQAMDMLPGDTNPAANSIIQQNYDRHKSNNIPRWDKPSSGGTSGGLWMETWATRCLDNNSVNHPLINIIEGIYGRDGNFLDGPGPNNLAQDYMTNVIIFGKNAFHVDIIGKYLGGHEPGNFGLFHMALERKLSSYLNPMDIPLYEWKSDGSATLTQLKKLPRAELKTLYLQRNYNNQNESYWHLVDEPFDYSKVTSVTNHTNAIPDIFELYHNYPNPFNPYTSIEYYIPKNGNVRLEVTNNMGEVVDVLIDKYLFAGNHLAVWNANSRASGIYFYRLLFDGLSKTKRMMLIR